QAYRYHTLGRSSVAVYAARQPIPECTSETVAVVCDRGVSISDPHTALPPQGTLTREAMHRSSSFDEKAARSSRHERWSRFERGRIFITRAGLRGRGSDHESVAAGLHLTRGGQMLRATSR